MLDRHGRVFGDLRRGARIGIGLRSALGPPEAFMVVWEAMRGGLQARREPFRGYGDPSIDVMLVGDAAAMAAITARPPEERLAALRHQVRQGGFVCFLMRVQCDLVEAGYEDVLASMGVVFMGACR